nr:hypothetical protein [Tanacetum cinerariifolium]
MSTQQDIYAAGSENHPPMLNKDNYVSWSSRIIIYARSRPNGKMIVESIENGTYVRRMIATPRRTRFSVQVPESFHEQTYEELRETDIKRMDADDQAIQTILLAFLKMFMLLIDKFRILEEMVDISLDSMLVKWHRISKGLMHGRMNGGIQGAQNVGVQSSGNQNGLVVVPGISNQSGTGNVVAARADGDLDEIEEVNANIILMANLQQASTSGTQHDKAPVYDTDGSAKVHLNDNCYDNEIFNMFTQEEQYTDLLEPIPEPQLVPQNDNHVTSIAPSMVQSGGTVETSFAPNEETRAHQETVYCNLVDQVAQEIKPANYAKINHLSGVFVPQTTKSKEELLLSNGLNMVTASKTIIIPNEDLSDDITPSVARKILNEVKSSLVTLQCVVKQKMTLEVHNWSSSAHKEVHRIISHEISPIINQVDDRVQNFEIQFLQEAAKFVRGFKSLTKEADESLDKQKSLELEIERLLKASISHDIMSIV